MSARLRSLVLLSVVFAGPALAQFGPETRLSNIAGPSITPKLAAGAPNLLHAVWSEFAPGGTQQIYHTRSINNGDSWSPPAPLSATATAVVPAIAANGSKVVVTWTDTIMGGDLYYRISADGGATWLAPQALYPAPGYSRPSGALVDSAGRIHVAWFDSRATGYGQVYYAMSCDNGASWSPLQRVNPQDDGIDNESPRLAEGADGTIYMLYRSSRDGNPQRGWPPFDHYLLRSTSVACGTGVAWLYPSQRVSRGLPEDLGNTYGGQIVAGQNGRMHLAWWRESSGNNLSYRGGFPKPASGAVPGFRNPVDVSRFGPNHLEFDLNTAEVGGFGLGEDTANVTHMVFAENNRLFNGFQVGSLYYARSTDGGVTFEPRQAAATGSDATGAHGVYQNGRFHMIWADFRDGNQGAEIYYRNLATSAAAPAVPGTATIVANPYGPITVQGGTLSGNVISNLQANVVIELGRTPGAAGSFAKIDFQGLSLGAGVTLTIRSGAAGQQAVLYNADGTASAIAGSVVAQGGAGIAAPILYVHNPNGVDVAAGGRIVGPSGLTIDTLGSLATVGQLLTNQGIVDGGSTLIVRGARITGGGAFKGDAVTLSSFGNINNPVNGAHYLANGVQLYPSAGTSVAVTLNPYGAAPQILNVMANGNATFWMPSIWPNGVTLPANSAPLARNAVRPPGTPEPSYGGGSMIVQATGTLALVGGGSNDFAFPGGVVIKAGGALDLKGVLVNQGWTTTGKAFQGVYFEAPTIGSSNGSIEVLSNNLNWVNFSGLPQVPARIWQLMLAPNGSASFVPADATAPHLNTYSVVIEAAANGQCWTCLISNAVIDID